MSNVICSTVESVLDGMGVPYRNEGEDYTIIVRDEVADFTVGITADEENELLVVVGFFPVKVSQANREHMFEVINDLNCYTKVGAFMLDPEDGELIFRIANNVDGGAINEEIVSTCFLQVVFRLRGCYDDIMKAMYGGPRMNFTFGETGISGSDETAYRS